jgi:signal transduction histidine kinase/CheY-like chemotaxis protein
MDPNTQAISQTHAALNALACGDPLLGSHHEHLSAQAAGTSATGTPFIDFFTGGGSYMPRIHCLVTPEGQTDWPWVVGLLVLTAGVIAAYLRIFLFWMRSYFAEQKRDRNPKLFDLAAIFLWCAVCGYGMSMVMFAWPGYRLLAVFLVVLNVYSWRFCFNLEPFRKAFGANRLERQLRETLENRAAELEKLVAVRTREAEEARALADRANKAKGDFLANMSHEIRTPLTAMLGFAEIISDTHQDSSDAAHAARMVVGNGNHLLSVVNDILDLSKIEAMQMTIEGRPTPLWDLIRDTTDQLRSRAIEKRIELHLEAMFPIPRTVITDPTRLRQVIYNVVGNAIKFTDRGGVRIDVSFRAQGSIGLLEVRVSDTGIGMCPEQLERLFQPFSQGDSTTARRFGGTGLGLFISKRLLELMGGSIECESQINRGATFTITVPAQIVSEAGMVYAFDDRTVREAAPAQPLRVAAPAPTIPARILVVDDGRDNRRLIQLHLERAGAEVSLAQHGREGVDVALAEHHAGRPFDLILMDMHMPVMDGAEATKALREAGVNRPILALTANAMVGERERCLEIGCDEYLSKPMTRDQLLSVCSVLLKRPMQPSNAPVPAPSPVPSPAPQVIAT